MDKFYLVVDLEATCWQDKSQEEKENKSEIIEIGAVLLDENKNVVGEFQSFVKPMVHRTLSDFCMNLTHINQRDVDNVCSFPYVHDSFLRFIEGREVVFCSWGEYDKKQFRRDCLLHHLVEFPDGEFINIKRLFAEKSCTPKCGVQKALAMLEMKFEGSPHRGIDDARNIAKIFKIITDPLFVKFPDLGLILKVENCLASIEGSLRQIKQAMGEYKNIRGGKDGK